jgi:hypothetical protein
MRHLCLHLNRNTKMPAAFILSLDSNEKFLGFVDFKDY